MLLNLFRDWLKPKYEPLNHIEIIKKNILDNFVLLKEAQPGAEIFPVLKSNAYGHGLKVMCQILNDTAAKMVVVDSFPEAQIVYKYWRGRVLILAEMPVEVYKHCRLDKTEFVIYNESTCRYLAENLPGTKVHLFFNTGMNREGISDPDNFLDTNKKYLNKLEVVGCCSHLASADDKNSELTKKQIEKFFYCLEALQHNGFNPKFIHLGNSAAIFYLRDSRLNAFRAGISLYGYNILPLDHPGFALANRLKPALKVFSKVIAIQSLKLGESVSYNETYRAPEEATKIALVPFGYYEGLDRQLSNLAEFRVFHGTTSYLAKIAGRVCMNCLCLEIKHKEINLGDKIEIISNQQNEPNSIYNLSNISQNIPYETLIRLRENIRRRIV